MNGSLVDVCIFFFCGGKGLFFLFLDMKVIIYFSFMSNIGVIVLILVRLCFGVKGCSYIYI